MRVFTVPRRCLKCKETAKQICWFPIRKNFYLSCSPTPYYCRLSVSHIYLCTLLQIGKVWSILQLLTGKRAATHAPQSHATCHPSAQASPFFLQWNPVHTDTKGTRRSVRRYPGVRIIRVSVLLAGSQKNVPDTYFIDTKTKADMFTATKRCVIATIAN